jgi:tetratricopeptide (TPR) repeat protein
MARERRGPPRGREQRRRDRAATRESVGARGHARTEAVADVAAAATPAASRAALALWIGLTLIALARAALTFSHGMWVWSLNVQRFLAPGWAWAPWAIAALALIPAIGRRLEPAAARAGDALTRWPLLATVLAGTALAMLCLALPDQVRFVGDFLIRQGTVEEAIRPDRVWPQALPLDALLHYHLPLALVRAGLADPNAAARALGAIEAFALGALGVALARALALRGSAALIALTISFGGYLGLFTGYGKAFTEMTIVTAGFAIGGLAAIRSGRGLLAMNVALALSLVLHRSALGLLPAAALAWALWARRFGDARAWRERSTFVALALPLGTLVAMLPRIIHILLTVDPVHFASADVSAGGGLLASSLTPERIADALNVIVLHAPLLPAGLLAGAALVFARALPRGREALFLATLALPLALSIPFVHALGGLFRDVDDFAAAGVALALLAAWLAGETLREAARDRAWLALPALLAVAMPGVQWLAHHADLERGLARVEALMREPPPRIESERGRTWDYLGARWNQLERYDASAAAFREACRTSPSPRMLQQLAIAEGLRGNLRGSFEAWRLTVARDSTNLSAWEGLAETASRLGERAELERALRQVVARDPSNSEARRILTALEAGAPLTPAP